MLQDDFHCVSICFVFINRQYDFNGSQAKSWSRCVICQNSTSEELRYPLKASGDRADPKAVYTSFLCNIFEFNALGAIPIALSMPLDINAE